MACNALFGDNGPIKKISTADWNALQGSSVAGVDSINNVTGDDTLVFTGTGTGPYTGITTAKVNPVLSIETLTLNGFEIDDPVGKPNSSVLTLNTTTSKCNWLTSQTVVSSSQSITLSGYGAYPLTQPNQVRTGVAVVGCVLTKIGSVLSITLKTSVMQFDCTGASNDVEFIGTDPIGVAPPEYYSFQQMCVDVGYAGNPVNVLLGTVPISNNTAGVINMCNVWLVGQNLIFQKTDGLATLANITPFDQIIWFFYCRQTYTDVSVGHLANVDLNFTTNTY